MLKYLVILITLLPAYAFAGTTEDTLQYILDDHLAFCMNEQAHFDNVEGQAAEPIKLKLTDDSIYQIDITAGGKKATVLHTNFSCNNIGYAWCGTIGCKSYVIVDGVSFETWGRKPVSVAVGDSDVVVLVPRAGGACINTNGQTPSNIASCYFAVVWDDYSQTFNSLGSGEPVFKLSDFMP